MYVHNYSKQYLECELDALLYVRIQLQQTGKKNTCNKSPIQNVLIFFYLGLEPKITPLHVHEIMVSNFQLQFCKAF